MTTTAPSKPKAAKKKTALESLIALEEVRETAKEEASRIGSEYHSKFQQFRGLLDRRHQLAHREPRLVDHQGQPAEPGNAIAEIDLHRGSPVWWARTCLSLWSPPLEDFGRRGSPPAGAASPPPALAQHPATHLATPPVRGEKKLAAP